MTISKGSPYGQPGYDLPEGAPTCSTDAEAATAIAGALSDGVDHPVVGLRGGDLCRTLGGPAGGSVAFPIDVVVVSLDGGPDRLAVGHVVARTRLWRRTWAVGNAAWLGDWNVWPKGHPGDALLDRLDADLPLGELRKVRARLRLGAHLPHPGLRMARSASHRLEVAEPRRVWIDGVDAGAARRVDVSLRVDGATVVV